MQTVGAAVFARIPSARDTSKTPALANSLHCGLNAPPAASQASVPGVASEDKPCSNDGTVGERTALKSYST
jgi:hypothetical protein